MTSPRYDQTIYHADPTRKSDAHEWVASYLGFMNELSILEVGCAMGQDFSKLFRKFPYNKFVGLDISDANIREAARTHSGAKWVAADYMTFSDGQFDLIISQRSLSVFQCTDDELASKLASDLTMHGLAVVTLPAPCLCTTVHFTLKRILRRVRTKFLDHLILALARKLRPMLDEETLADRLMYVYIVPLRVAGKKFYSALRRHGLVIEQDRQIMRCTPVDTHHRLLVLRKVG